jgi:hypothetical protein
MHGLPPSAVAVDPRMTAMMRFVVVVVTVGLHARGRCRNTGEEHAQGSDQQERNDLEAHTPVGL